MLAAYRGESWAHISLPLECIFFFDMLTNCVTDYTDKMGSYEFKVKDIFKIAVRYIKGPFFMDFLPLLPLQMMTLYRNQQNVFFLVKTMRIVRGF